MNSLMIVGCTLLVYSPTKQFFFLHLPYILSCLSSPKCVFLLVNVIVVFLVGESRLSGYNNSRRSSSTSDFYDEYIRRARAQRKCEIASIESETSEQEEQQVLVNEDAKNGDEVEEQVEEKIEAAVEEVEAKGGGDELNRRIEDFIARVNRRRQLEIQSLVSCKA
ncbi:unnamed protein product [Linum tenue]|uniref:DUF4408 domain-containing protein n=1 Tax=Linum tenue TaxID=586396 RepID=A0AAV0H7N8_9ROSI|nr:unnamed protein product [Linum tenue]CAI0381329.1 unnamed protein product [Linum tenue]